MLEQKNIDFAEIARKYSDPALRRYIAASDVVRDALAYKLYLESGYGSPDKAVGLLKILPDNVNIIGRMRKTASRAGIDSSVRNLCEAGRRAGYPVEALVSESARQSFLAGK